MTDTRAHGEEALAAFDRALAAKPSLDAVDFTAATEHLCRMRDLVIKSDQPDRQAVLSQINAVMSCSLSGHFPLGQVSWPLIGSARASLQALLARMAA